MFWLCLLMLGMLRKTSMMLLLLLLLLLQRPLLCSPLFSNEGDNLAKEALIGKQPCSAVACSVEGCKPTAACVLCSLHTMHLISVHKGDFFYKDHL